VLEPHYAWINVMSSGEWRDDEKTYSIDVNVRIISVGKRLRKLRQDKVDEIAESIKRGFLLQPIVIRPKKDSCRYDLVIGAHRLAAVKQLGLKTIKVEVIADCDDDQALLAEIDENLIRAELTQAERAQHIDARKAIWEKLYPETKHGAAPGKAGGGKEAKETKLDSFAEATAKATGKSKTKIKRDATRGKKVVVLPDIVGTSLDKGVELDALAKLPVEKQRQLAERAKAGEQVSAVTDEKIRLNGQTVDIEKLGPAAQEQIANDEAIEQPGNEISDEALAGYKQAWLEHCLPHVQKILASDYEHAEVHHTNTNYSIHWDTAQKWMDAQIKKITTKLHKDAGRDATGSRDRVLHLTEEELLKSLDRAKKILRAAVRAERKIYFGPHPCDKRTESPAFDAACKATATALADCNAIIDQINAGRGLPPLVG
jgi:ParB family transcriptional regulator, chromosome partitioning protein